MVVPKAFPAHKRKKRKGQECGGHHPKTLQSHVDILIANRINNQRPSIEIPRFIRNFHIQKIHRRDQPMPCVPFRAPRPAPFTDKNREIKKPPNGKSGGFFPETITSWLRRGRPSRRPARSSRRVSCASCDDAGPSRTSWPVRASQPEWPSQLRWPRPRSKTRQHQRRQYLLHGSPPGIILRLYIRRWRGWKVAGGKDGQKGLIFRYFNG